MLRREFHHWSVISHTWSVIRRIRLCKFPVFDVYHTVFFFFYIFYAVFRYGRTIIIGKTFHLQTNNYYYIIMIPIGYYYIRVDDIAKTAPRCRRRFIHFVRSANRRQRVDAETVDRGRYRSGAARCADGTVGNACKSSRRRLFVTTLSRVPAIPKRPKICTSETDRISRQILL